MPLTQFTGVSNLHTTLCIAWAVLSNEEEAAYGWALEDLKQLVQQESIQTLTVFVSDYDKALKNAFASVYGDNVRQQLYLWHTMKNVAFHIKVHYQGSICGTCLAETVGGDGSQARLEADTEIQEHNHQLAYRGCGFDSRRRHF